MKIYTGGGDRGKTSLFSGERVDKEDVQIEAYGDVDELNSAVGLLIPHLDPSLENVRSELIRIQSDLFHAGGWLATTPESPSLASLRPLTASRVDFLESAIDRMDGELPPLTQFILPGGHVSAGVAHMARTICRRAERHVVRLAASRSNPDHYAGVLTYLNRLSDYLFVLARYLNRSRGVADTPWER